VSHRTLSGRGFRATRPVPQTPTTAATRSSSSSAAPSASASANCGSARPCASPPARERQPGGSPA